MRVRYSRRRGSILHRGNWVTALITVTAGMNDWDDCIQGNVASFRATEEFGTDRAYKIF